MTTPPKLTVAICTYRRLEPLRSALASLARCDAIDAPWELIVVDNAGWHRVQELVAQFADMLPVRYMVERTTGLSHARNLAIEQAGAPVVLFTDDDVTFDRAWLSAMSQAIFEHDECDFWGGRIEADWHMDRPRWFDAMRCPMLDDMLVHYDAGNTSGYWDRAKHKPFFGASLAVRVSAVNRVGGFDPSAGHCGEKSGAGEDSLMIDAIESAGGRGWYCADAQLLHPVPPQRVTRTFARKFSWRQGWVSTETHRRLETEQAQKLPRWWYRSAIEQSLAGAAQWVGGSLRGNAAVSFAGQFRMLYNASRFWHAMRKRDTCPS